MQVQERKKSAWKNAILPFVFELRKKKRRKESWCFNGFESSYEFFSVVMRFEREATRTCLLKRKAGKNIVDVKFYSVFVTPHPAHKTRKENQ